MQVRIELECFPNEVRRLVGGADTGPLAGLWHALIERTLIEACNRQMPRGERSAEASAPRGPELEAGAGGQAASATNPGASRR